MAKKKEKKNMPGVIAGGAKLYCKFTTRDAGVPTTLAGSPAVSVYKDDSTTESTAGVTLDVDFDGRTGLNHVTIDTSADTSFYANGHHYELVITAGTVAGNSVVGEVVLPGGFDLSASAGTAGDADVIRTATCPSQSGMTSTQIKLDSGASGTDNAYQWDAISIVGGTGAGQSRVITAYTGSTKVSTVDWAWLVQPDNTSIFAVTPTTRAEVVGVPDVRLADGVAHGGTPGSSTATLAVSKLQIVNSIDSDAAVAMIGAQTNYGLYIEGGSASGSTGGCAAVNIVGGAASTTSGGISRPGIAIYGGDGATATNPAAVAIAIYSGFDNGAGGSGAMIVQSDTITDTVQVTDGSSTVNVLDNEGRVAVRIPGL